MPVVIVARRSDCGHRDRVWAHCRARWARELGWPLVEGDVAGDPFCRAHALNEAARLAGGWDVAVIVDADVELADVEQVAAAVDLAHRTGKLVYAHDHLSLLTEEGTERRLAGEPLGPALTDGVRHPNTWSSALAVPRALWDTVGGYDERFVDWGWEDLAFMASCGALAGVARVPGDAYHLWHPRSWEANEGNPHHSANQVLGQRYLAAMGNRNAMLAILTERSGSSL